MNRLLQKSSFLGTLLWISLLCATDLLAQTTIVLPKSCKGCPLSTNGTGEITSFDNCAAASSGTLTAGTPASAVTQTIAVTVGKIGTYNLAAIANGVIFSASGTFTTTGSQQLTLTATGTPLASGTYSYTLNTTPTCSFTRSTNAAGNSKFALAPCGYAFNNIKSFGIQSMGMPLDGRDMTGATSIYTWGAHNAMFLAADGKTIYDTRGRYADTTLIPAIYSPASFGAHLDAVIPIHVVRQLFPNTTFKAFAQLNASASYPYAGEYLFLLTEQNDLYAIILNPGYANTSNNNVYNPWLGSSLGGTQIPAGNTTAWTNDVYRVVKITSDSQKFSSFWHNTIRISSWVMFGYNPADNLVYSWGADVNLATNTTPTASGSQVLFRTASNLTASLTPAPATIINTILQRNNTSLKEMSDSLITFVGGATETYPSASTKFIGKDGAVYRYWPQTGAHGNHRITLPNGAKAIGLVQRFGSAGRAIVSDYAILGDDGKIYQDGMDDFNNVTPKPTGLDIPITASLFSNDAATNALNFKQIFSVSAFPAFGGQYKLLGLTKDGKVYRVYSKPNLAQSETQQPTVDYTTTYSLPLFSRIFSTGGTVEYFLGKSSATGNCISFIPPGGYEGENLGHLNATSASASANLANHKFNDNAQLDTSKTSQGYLWFNCYDPWNWNK